MTELEVDYLAATHGASPINISKFQLDSAALYAAASNQYAQGVMGTYRLLGHPEPESNSTARDLLEVAQSLANLIKRHRDLMGEQQTIVYQHQSHFPMETTSTMEPVVIQP